MYQPIKFTKEQYWKLKQIIRREFGNVSLTKGIYLITYGYLKLIPRHKRLIFSRKFYQPMGNRRRNIRWKRV